MASPYTVAVYDSSINQYVPIENVQNLQHRVGQTYYLEPIQTSTLTFNARYPEGYSTPNPLLTVGEQVFLYYNYTGPFDGSYIWSGFISETSVDYGKPWNGTTGEGDTIRVSCIGWFGQFSTYNINVLTGDKTVDDILGEISLESDGLLSFNVPANVLLRKQHTTPSKQVFGDWLQNFYCTFHLVPVEIEGPQFMSFIEQGVPYFRFSDAPTAPEDFLYDTLSISALSMERYSTVVVEGQDGSTATEPTVIAGQSLQTLNLASLSNINADALEMARIVYSNVSDPAQRITSVVARDSQQDGGVLAPLQSMVGNYARVEFRGSELDAMVIGWQLDADQSDGTWTFYLVPKSYYSYLTLDDDHSAEGLPSLGALDENRLGY